MKWKRMRCFEDQLRRATGTFVIPERAGEADMDLCAVHEFKLDWSDAAGDFILAKTGEKVKALLSRLINQQLGQEAVTLPDHFLSLREDGGDLLPVESGHFQ